MRHSFTVIETLLLLIFLVLPILAYVGAGLLLALRAVRDESGGRDIATLLALVAIVLHAGWHLHGWHVTGGPDMHFFAALSLVALGMAALTVTMSFMRRLQALGIVVYPLAALMLALAVGYGHVRAEPLDWRLQLHAWLALLAFATLAIAALLAVLQWLQERALQRRELGGWLRALPPLVQLETLLFRTIAAGFALLTLALITGVVFVDNLMAQHLVHKTVLSALSWLVFGWLLVGRWRYGWRGPRAVKFTLIAMALLFLAFFGSQFVLELILHRDNASHSTSVATSGQTLAPKLAATQEKNEHPPISKTSLVRQSDAISTLSPADEARSASEKFTKYLTCSKAKRMRKWINDISKDPHSWANDEAAAAQIAPTDWEAMKQNVDLVQSSEWTCQGMDAALSDGSIYRVALRAALLGDTRAADCYVFASFEAPAAMHNDPSQFADYRDHARPLLAAGLQRGDWGTVQILGYMANEGRGHRDSTLQDWMYQLTPSSASDAYRYVRLQRLGATPTFAATLDPELSAMAAELRPAEVISADKWATDTYARYFSYGPRRNGNESFCDY